MENKLTNNMWDCVVVGGGITGLTASIILAEAGLSVLLLEKSKKVGGRARTEVKEEAYLNLGPHALYSKGLSLKMLNDLGIHLKGNSPKINGSLIYNERSYKLPTDPIQVLRSPLFSSKGKVELLSFYIKLYSQKLIVNPEVTVSDWLQQNIHEEQVRQFLLMLIRLSTYCDNPNLINVQEAFTQLRLGKPIYLDFGWQTMVKALTEKAIALGVFIQTGISVKQVQGEFPRFFVTLSDNTFVCTKNLLVTGSPKEAVKIIQGISTTVSLLDEFIPIHAACMDIVLKSLPNSKINFALSMDEGLYFSNHSSAATLSTTEKYSVIHVMKYLRSDFVHEELYKQEIESFLHRIQPGWEEHVVFRRYLPKLTVTHVHPHRKQEITTDVPGLLLAGDWVGTEGMLADRAFSSAKKAANLIIERCREVRI